MSTAPTPDEDAGALLHRSRRLEDASEAVIQRAIGLWHAPSAVPASPAGAWRRLAATLRFDSATSSPQALGLRAAGRDGTRQLFFFSDGRDIEVRVIPASTPDGTRWRVTGQVLGPDAIGSTELRSGASISTCDWNDLAEFNFQAVAAGRCVLVLRGADWELELPPFELPA